MDAKFKAELAATYKAQCAKLVALNSRCIVLDNSGQNSAQAYEDYDAAYAVAQAQSRNLKRLGVAHKAPEDVVY